MRVNYQTNTPQIPPASQIVRATYLQCFIVVGANRLSQLDERKVCQHMTRQQKRKTLNCINLLVIECAKYQDPTKWELAMPGVPHYYV
jgi:hypothetical protein